MASNNLQPFSGQLDSAQAKPNLQAFDGTLDGEKPTRSLARSAGDSAIALGSGVVQGAKMVTDVAGADNAASRALGSATQALTDLESPYRKAQKQERATKIQAAEATGRTWEEVKAHVGAFADAPLDTTLNALGTSAPTIAAAAIPGLGQAALATRAAQVGVGVAQGVGNIKGNLFDAVKQQHMAAGMPEAEATKRADAAQAYGGENAGSIALGGVLGGLAGGTGVETAARNLLGRKLASEAAERAAPGVIRSAVGGALKEAPMEALQGGQERLASNTALQGEGFDVPTWQGVAGQAALEGLASAPMGGGFGAAEGLRARAQQRAAAQAAAGDPTAAWETQPGAADPNAPAAGQGPVPEAPDLQTELGAAPARADGLDYQRDVDTSGLSLENPAEAERARRASMDYEPGDATPQWETELGAAPERQPGLDMPSPDYDTAGLGLESRQRLPSQILGIDPAAGPLSRGAAMAVDAAPIQEAQFLGATGRDLQVRRSGPGVTDESRVIDVQGRVVEDRAIETPRRLTDQQDGMAARALGGDIAAQPPANRGSAPALPAPTNLRDAIARIRAQKQEAARLAQVPPTQGANLVPQAPQAIQASPQSAQAGPAQAADTDAASASSPAPAGAPEVRALSDGRATPANPGAQTAPAATPQGVAQAAPAAVAERPKNWRTSMLGAKPVARELGIDTKGKRLAQVVAEIDAFDAAQAPSAQQQRDDFRAAKAEAELTRMTQADSVTHQDPGQKAEAATPGVVTDSLKKAARNEDTKPSEMRKWLVGKIDDAIAVAPEAAVDFLSFDVPGDGTFKVQNSQARLQEFRKNVMASPGFKDGGQKQNTKPLEQVDSARNGSGSTVEAIRNFLADGDVEGAMEFAKLKGVEFTPVEPRASITANGKFKRVPASVKSSVPSVAEGLTQVEAEQINQYLTAERQVAEAVAQPITRADVTAAQQQAAAIITERIDAMTAGEVNTIARRFLPTMGVRPTVSKERNKAAVTDFTKVNPLAAADEFGATLPTDVRRALQADMEGAVADGFVEQGAEAKSANGVAMFSRTGAQSSNAQQPTTRAWYDRFVSLLPASYRNDSHRREPLPAEDWNVQRSAEIREKIDALNKQLRGANDRKGYGPVSADGLGNLQVDARSVSAADLSGPIRALADELGAGVAATNVRSSDVRALLGVGFVSETSLAAIADRLMGRPFAQPVNTYTKDSAPGTILTYKPRGFPAALFSRSATPPADSNERAAGLSPEQAVAMFNQATPPNPYPHKLQATLAAAKHGASAVQADNGGWLLAPKAQAYTAQELQDAQQRIDKLNRALKKHNNVAPAAVLSDAPTPAMAWGRSIARTLGYNVTFIQPNPDFHGVAVGGDAFVSASADHPEIGLIGHEVLHSFKQSSPDIYQALAERIRPYLKDGVVDAKRRWEDANGGRNTSMAHAEEEVLADLNGAMWLDPKFWREMAKNDQSLFRQVAYKFMEVATKAMQGLSRFKADSLVTDVDAVREIIAQEWAYQAQEIGNPSEFVAPDSPAFSRTPGDQTQTEAFKRWFGGSKAVDAEGKPLVVYHGTGADFSVFTRDRAGATSGAANAGMGFFFTDQPEVAGRYAAMSGGAQSVMPVNLSLQNPIRLTAKNMMEADKLLQSQMKPEHDGAIIEVAMRDGGVQTVFMAKESSQVKSSTGNNGDFDPANADIRFSRTTDAAKAVGDTLKSITVSNVKQRAGFKLTDYLGIGLQALGRRQIVDIYGDTLPLAEYNKLVQQMEADKNEGGAEADQLVSRWAKLDDERRLAEVMHDATLAQIDADGDVAYEVGDAKAKSAMLKGRFKALSAEAQKVYRDTRDSYKNHHNQVRNAIKERIERSDLKGERKAALLAQMDGEFFKAVKGVYFPLARFGQYAVTVKGPDGKVESVSRAETMAEAQALRSNLLSAFPSSKGFAVGRVMLSKDFIADRDAVGRGFMTELYQVLDKQDMDAVQRAELEDTLGQLYLSSLPDLSWAKHGIHRKGTPGFSQDARRAFAQNMFHGARYLAKLRYSDLMQDELAAMQKHVDDWREVSDFDQPTAQRVVDEMNKRHDALMNPKSNALSTALTSFGFIFHLGLSPASAMVNLTQTALVAYPLMGAKWGFGKASAALLKASQQAAKGKNDITASLNADERAAYDEAARAGTIDVTMAHDLAGIAQGEDAGVMWKLRPVMRWASFMFHHAERFNRQVTFVAAYRLAREAGADQKAAFEQATKATYDGHYDYSAANRPRIMQGNVAKVLLLFKQYGQNMVYTLVRNAQQSLKGATPEARAQARKALGGLLAMHGLAAGALGLPMVTTLLAAASMLGGDDDEPWDAQVALQNMLADAFGQKAAEVLAHGLSRLTPWDISGRVGLDKLIFPDLQEGLEGQRLGESAMAAALGPVAGIGINVLKGIQEMSEGRYLRGLETMAPSVARGPLKALRYGDEGVRDKTGIVVQDEVDAASLLGQAAGFSPSSVRNSFEGKSAIVQYDRALQARRSALVEQFAMAAMAGDEEGKAAAREDIAQFNEKNPNRRIQAMQLAQSVAQRQKRIREAQGGVYLPSKRRDALEVGRFAVAE